ncbi:hypothetical protein HOLleu_31290 [Holothuria leucospilota]|uniref:Reverse transcriptase domain-containing protein n=1 Tax=Holothuria leucospilota TaxID=206669 RepID=A0A9Q0YQ17_HOLLE|nr:hypothetical protein HOLleu_31290 [Holothuria leucospilota]
MMLMWEMPHQSSSILTELTLENDNISGMRFGTCWTMTFIEPSNSEWSSPCILVPKADGGYRFCTDYRKVNAVTRTDSYPIPRIDDCIDRVGKATYVSKFDLLKGYWEIPLTERAGKSRYS